MARRTARQQQGRDYTIPSVAAAVQVLRWLMDRRGTLSQISAALSLSKSTTYAILKTLQGGVVAYDEATRCYRLGVELLRLGEAAVRQLEHIAPIKPVLRSVVDETNLTGILAQRLDGHLVVVHKEEGRSEIRATMSLGQVVPPGVGAMGKVFAAFWQPGGDSGRGGSPGSGERSGSPKSKAALKEVRTHGYAASREEYRLGVNAVAAPVFDHRGQLALVLCLIGFAASMPIGRLASYGELLRARCADASRVLGHRIEADGVTPM